jgi:hypothetical protein
VLSAPGSSSRSRRSSRACYASTRAPRPLADASPRTAA